MIARFFLTFTDSLDAQFLGTFDLEYRRG
jgi:hypothetical protein